MKYYDAQEARRVLSVLRPNHLIHPNTLKKYVDSGTLKKYYPPGRAFKRGYYSADEVDKLAQELRQFYGVGNGSTRK